MVLDARHLLTTSIYNMIMNMNNSAQPQLKFNEFFPLVMTHQQKPGLTADLSEKSMNDMKMASGRFHGVLGH